MQSSTRDAIEAFWKWWPTVQAGFVSSFETGDAGELAERPSAIPNERRFSAGADAARPTRSRW